MATQRISPIDYSYKTLGLDFLENFLEKSESCQTGGFINMALHGRRSAFQWTVEVPVLFFARRVLASVRVDLQSFFNFALQTRITQQKV